MRFGLCCLFSKENIKFSTTTVSAISKLSRKEALDKISNIVLFNAHSLQSALNYCHINKIKSFRITSDLAPIKTHPNHGYSFQDLKDCNSILDLYDKCREFSIQNNIRTVFHPDQFVILNSPKPDVVESSIRELNYHLELAKLLNVDVINIHGGGVYGDKKLALNNLQKTIDVLPEELKRYLTFENDDKSYTPKDLLPICIKNNIPLVYDVHHHRCNPDGFTVEDATQKSLETWSKAKRGEPLFHISSPKEGWQAKNTRMHHDFISNLDFPDCWKNLNITVEVEAKAKEEAVKLLMEYVNEL